MKNMKNPLVLLAVVLGIVFVALAVVYFVEPAKSLPSFLPGYDPMIAKTHFKHGIGALFLGLGAFAFAWFQTGKKSTSTPPTTKQ